ncbi:ATP synthase subunit s, mitochondrial [Microplitis demolitor]|uniref:ATP synthase subunit s, mitochondrial n=1 Tax=Microplitis demolitor TaxID=69319 RepID=UPI00235B64EE|nr:ATP synthase subunit s, mitochondrial [Microplitis demolitor]
MILNSNSFHKINLLPKRFFFRWLIPVFNNVSKKKIDELGSDLACAEWLVRNGAAVKWKKIYNNTDQIDNNYSNNYDKLPSTSSGMKYVIYGVDATDSAISHEGFPHFDGCKYIAEMKLINCLYVGNQALNYLNLLKDSLEYLEIKNCVLITDEGLGHLTQLTNLKTLELENLPAIKNKNLMKKTLNNELKNCAIIYK